MGTKLLMHCMDMLQWIFLSLTHKSWCSQTYDAMKKCTKVHVKLTCGIPLACFLFLFNVLGNTAIPWNFTFLHLILWINYHQKYLDKLWISQLSMSTMEYIFYRLCFSLEPSNPVYISIKLYELGTICFKMRYLKKK